MKNNQKTYKVFKKNTSNIKDITNYWQFIQESKKRKV
jgi:hypothetical protein